MYRLIIVSLAVTFLAVGCDGYWQEQYKETAAECKKLTEENHKLTAKVYQLQDQVRDLSGKLEKEAEGSTGLEQKLAGLEEQVKVLSIEAEKAKGLAEENKELREKVEEAAERIRVDAELLQKIRDEVKVLEKRLKDLEGHESRVEPGVFAKSYGLLADGCLCVERFDTAREAYKKAEKYGGRAGSGRCDRQEIIRWRFTEKVLDANPTGLYRRKSLSERAALKEAFRDLAPEWVDKAEAQINQARKATCYDEAISALGRCDSILGVLEVLDPERAEKTVSQVMVAKEDIIASEIERLLGEVEQIRGEILLNHPRRTYWQYYYEYGWRWEPSGVYLVSYKQTQAEQLMNRTNYERAMSYWELFPAHNSNVKKMSTYPPIVQKRINELRDHQASDKCKEVSLSKAWDKYQKRLDGLVRYPAPPEHKPWVEGERIAELVVPRKPSLVIEREPIKVRDKDITGRKGSKY